MRDARAAEDRVQRACEEHLREYKNSAELKAKIQQTCEARFEEYQAFEEVKERIYREAFCMFALGYIQGLKAVRDALSTLLENL